MQSNGPQSHDSVPPADRPDAASSGTRYLDPAALSPLGDDRVPPSRGRTARAVLAAMVLAVGISSAAVIVRGGSAAADPSLAGIPSAPIVPAPASPPTTDAATTTAAAPSTAPSAAATTTRREPATSRATTAPRTSVATRSTTTTTRAQAAARYASCDAARDAGAAPLRRGDAGYREALDPDGDGVACEAAG